MSEAAAIGAGLTVLDLILQARAAHIRAQAAADEAARAQAIADMDALFEKAQAMHMRLAGELSVLAARANDPGAGRI